MNKSSKQLQPICFLLNELAKRIDGRVTLIIDESNLAFTITPDIRSVDV